MKKSILILCFISFTNLISCTSSLDPLATKPIPTNEQLTSSIASMTEWQQLHALQAEINLKMHDIINNASPAFIAKYKLLRNNYSSFPELVFTANAADHDQFVVLWNELTNSIQDKLIQRDSLLKIIHNKTNSQYTVTDLNFFKAMHGSQDDVDQSRAKVDGICDDYGDMMGDRYGVEYLNQGYSLDYALGAAEVISAYYTDQCNEGGRDQGQWC